ncbi:unnamed protein product [Darwinula stevensoni]|uniref:Uncharacterized protein n=1 Tax=Darwinula stevensoni TaxID=69355 RepID=A0A7R8X9X2_9CRUS|nr:unnamed protein product [Darwinula stevensoni]CAG0886059.1 unnamed protein product [Darwinula stevensoni]
MKTFAVILACSLLVTWSSAMERRRHNSPSRSQPQEALGGGIRVVEGPSLRSPYAGSSGASARYQNSGGRSQYDSHVDLPLREQYEEEDMPEQDAYAVDEGYETDTRAEKPRQQEAEPFMDFSKGFPEGFGKSIPEFNFDGPMPGERRLHRRRRDAPVVDKVPVAEPKPDPLDAPKGALSLKGETGKSLAGGFANRGPHPSKSGLSAAPLAAGAPNPPAGSNRDSRGLAGEEKRRRRRPGKRGDNSASNPSQSNPSWLGRIFSRGDKEEAGQPKQRTKKRGSNRPQGSTRQQGNKRQQNQGGIQGMMVRLFSRLPERLQPSFFRGQESRQRGRRPAGRPFGPVGPSENEEFAFDIDEGRQGGGGGSPFRDGPPFREGPPEGDDFGFDGPPRDETRERDPFDDDFDFRGEEGEGGSEARPGRDQKDLPYDITTGAALTAGAGFTGAGTGGGGGRDGGDRPIVTEVYTVTHEGPTTLGTATGAGGLSTSVGPEGGYQQVVSTSLGPEINYDYNYNGLTGPGAAPGAKDDGRYADSAPPHREGGRGPPQEGGSPDYGGEGPEGPDPDYGRDSEDYRDPPDYGGESYRSEPSDDYDFDPYKGIDGGGDDYRDDEPPQRQPSRPQPVSFGTRNVPERYRGEPEPYRDEPEPYRDEPEPYRDEPEPYRDEPVNRPSPYRNAYSDSRPERPFQGNTDYNEGYRSDNQPQNTRGLDPAFEIASEFKKIFAAASNMNGFPEDGFMTRGNRGTRNLQSEQEPAEPREAEKTRRKRSASPQRGQYYDYEDGYDSSREPGDYGETAVSYSVSTDELGPNQHSEIAVGYSTAGEGGAGGGGGGAGGVDGRYNDFDSEYGRQPEGQEDDFGEIEYSFGGAGGAGAGIGGGEAGGRAPDYEDEYNPRYSGEQQDPFFDDERRPGGQRGFEEDFRGSFPDFRGGRGEGGGPGPEAGNDGFDRQRNEDDSFNDNDPEFKNLFTENEEGAGEGEGRDEANDFNFNIRDFEGDDEEGGEGGGRGGGFPNPFRGGRGGGGGGGGRPGQGQTRSIVRLFNGIFGRRTSPKGQINGRGRSQGGRRRGRRRPAQGRPEPRRPKRDTKATELRQVYPDPEDEEEEKNGRPEYSRAHGHPPVFQSDSQDSPRNSPFYFESFSLPESQQLPTLYRNQVPDRDPNLIAADRPVDNEYQEESGPSYFPDLPRFEPNDYVRHPMLHDEGRHEGEDEEFEVPIPQQFRGGFRQDSKDEEYADEGDNDGGRDRDSAKHQFDLSDARHHRDDDFGPLLRSHKEDRPLSRTYDELDSRAGEGSQGFFGGPPDGFPDFRTIGGFGAFPDGNSRDAGAGAGAGEKSYDDGSENADFESPAYDDDSYTGTPSRYDPYGPQTEVKVEASLSVRAPSPHEAQREQDEPETETQLEMKPPLRTERGRKKEKLRRGQVIDVPQFNHRMGRAATRNRRRRTGRPEDDLDKDFRMFFDDDKFFREFGEEDEGGRGAAEGEGPEGPEPESQTYRPFSVPSLRNRRGRRKLRPRIPPLPPPPPPLRPRRQFYHGPVEDFSEEELSLFGSHNDNRILGSGNFEILHGGTFKAEEDSVEPGYHNEKLYDSTFRKRPPPKGDFFSNFRDFADIHYRSSLSEQSEVRAKAPVTVPVKGQASNIQEKLVRAESRADVSDVNVKETDSDPMLGVF